jgi:RecB family exonuclease
MTRAWHASSLATLLGCGIAYERRYLRKEYTPATTRMLRGAAVHRALGQGLGLQLTSGTPAPVELYEDVAATEVDRARHGGATLTAEEMSTGVAATWGGLKDAAVQFAGHYGENVAPTVTPVAIERRVTVDAIPGLPDVTLIGTMDQVTREADGAEMVRDDKSTERTPMRTAADTSGQLTMYALLRSLETGTLVSRVALDHLVRSPKTGEVKHVHQPSTRTSADLHALVRRIAAADRAVQAGIFLPAAPEDWRCSERYCPFWSDCSYAQGRK